MRIFPVPTPKGLFYPNKAVANNVCSGFFFVFSDKRFFGCFADFNMAARQGIFSTALIPLNQTFVISKQNANHSKAAYATFVLKKPIGFHPNHLIIESILYCHLGLLQRVLYSFNRMANHRFKLIRCGFSWVT